MYKIFHNNVFTNPIGWAKSAVGKAWGYRLFQGCTVFLGVMLFLFFKIISADFDFSTHPSWVTYINVGTLIFVPVILFPLCYLRALRAMYLHFSEQIETLPANKNAKESKSKDKYL